MDLEEYFKQAKKYHKNPKRHKLNRLVYLVLKGQGEYGEFSDELAKAYRNKGGKITKARKQRLAEELGDVFNLLFRFCKEADLTLGEVLEIHLEKLKNKDKPF